MIWIVVVVVACFVAFVHTRVVLARARRDAQTVERLLRRLNEE